MSLERRIKRVALSVALLLVPAGAVYVARDGLVAQFLKVTAPAEVEAVTLSPEQTSRLATDQDAWHRVPVEKPEPAAAAPAPAATAPTAVMAEVPAPQNAIQIRQPTQPVPIGKAAR